MSASSCFSLCSNEQLTECLETAAEKIASKPWESTSLNKAKVALDGAKSRVTGITSEADKIADHSESRHKVVSSSNTTARSVFSAY